MIYKAVAVWLAIQIPLGMLVGLMLRRAEVANRAGHRDEPDVQLAVTPAGMAMRLHAS